MKQPTRRERIWLQRLRKPIFAVEFSSGEILRQLGAQPGTSRDHR